MNDQPIDYDVQRRAFRLSGEQRAEYQKHGENVYAMRWPDGVDELRRVSDDSILTLSECQDYNHQLQVYHEERAQRHEIAKSTVISNHGFHHMDERVFQLARELLSDEDRLHPFHWIDMRDSAPSDELCIAAELGFFIQNNED